MAEEEAISWGAVDDKQRAKALVVTLYECLKSKIGNPEKAFCIFDANMEGTITVQEFEWVLHTFGQEKLTEGDINVLVTVAHGSHSPTKIIK